MRPEKQTSKDVKAGLDRQRRSREAAYDDEVNNTPKEAIEKFMIPPYAGTYACPDPRFRPGGEGWKAVDDERGETDD